MIIPVRCFTCGKARLPRQPALSAAAPRVASAPSDALRCPRQVIGNKWDTYLDLLQADYSEWCAILRGAVQNRALTLNGGSRLAATLWTRWGCSGTAAGAC